MDAEKEKKDEGWLTPGKVQIGMGVIFVFSLVLAGGVCWFYYDNFHANGLAETNAAWGTFGDYIGGVLNPIFGFFGLMALLLTIIMQSIELRDGKEQLKKAAESLEVSSEAANQQIQHLQNQAKKEDLYRMIKNIYTEVEKEFSKKITINYSNGKSTTGQFQYFFGGKKIIEAFNIIAQSDEENGPGNDATLAPIVDLLIELYDYLYEYEKLAKDDVISLYIKRRLYGYCSDMYKKGYLTIKMASFYCPDQIRKSAESDPA
jgi:uncharacterized membrane protein